MHRLLVIAWYFPPIGGPGVQRTVKFCKYLSRLGWEITVIGGIDPDEHQDPTLEKDLPPGIAVHRLGRPATFWRRLRTWMFARRIGPIGLGRIAHWIGYVRDFPDTMREWAEEVVDLAVREHRERPFDLIYSTSFPYSVHIAALTLKRRLNIPWVADLRDPWAENELVLGHLPSWMRARHARAEQRMAEGADALVCAHPAHAERMRARYGLPSSRCVAITNGYDPEDYVGFPDPPAVEADGLVRLVHTGSFYGAYSPEPLLRALDCAWRPMPEAIQTLELWFVGGDSGVPIPKRPGLRVVTFPRVSHDEALRQQADAHLLLCVFDRQAGPTHLPGKLFEYLAAGRPILAVIPADGATAEIIRETRSGWVADCERPEEILRTLREALSAIIRPGFRHAPDSAAVARYSRPALARQFDRLLQEITPQ